MKNQPEKNKRNRPTERQSADKLPDESTLHQGQGPDFITQDQSISEKNPGIQEMQQRSIEKATNERQESQHDPDTMKEENPHREK